MAKVSTNPIQNLDEDWGNDPNVNLPFSGEAVQAFIKSYLRNVTAAAYFDPTNYTMYFFASEEDRNSFINDPSQTSLPTFSCPMNFSSTLYRVNITNNTGTTNINVATNSGTCPISATFVVQTKSITDLAWTDTQTGCYVTIMIDRGLTGIYENITERTLYPAGATISYDVFSELVQGVNRVKIQFEAEDDSVSQALTYTINLAELYVELFNNFWYQPVMQSDPASQQFGGFKIAGAGSKTLHISVYDSAGVLKIEDIPILIGTTNAYVNTPYYYRIPNNSEFLNLPTGVYKLRVWVSTTAINSEYIEYNLMYVRTADVSTAKLVCVNFVADKIFNYSNAVLCQYALFNADASYANITVTFQQKDNGTVVHSQTTSIANLLTEMQQNLGYEALWPGIEGEGYSIGFEIEMDTASAEGDVPLDNSTVFPPTPEYDFYMLAANRSNGETNREKVINVADGSELAATWTDIDFFNGVDGWTVDDNNRPCLRIPAKCRMVLPASAFNLLSGDNQTFEIAYKAANCADDDENIITISPNPTEAGFKGIRIRPTNITVHNTSNTDASSDLLQGTNLCDEEVVHFVLTINPYYSGTRKLVKAYINGCKNFLFEYTDSTQWSGFNGNLVIGSDYTDVFVYLIRHYPVALSDTAVQTNYINSLTSVSERDAMNYRQSSVLDPGATNIDFETVKNNDYNFFVIQMTQGSGVPSAANHWSKDTKGVSILEMHYGKHPEWDWKIEDVETMGQGTTSMNYYRWNIRWRIDKSNDDKKVPVSYCTRSRLGSSYVYTWGEPSLSKTVRFDGDNHPGVMRITGKINAASSMQSHKIGATRAYTALHDAIGLVNEAQAAAISGGTPRPTVAVYEYPAFGFEYDPQSGSYTYIGLFTIGPDKGDKPTFGYDTVKSSLISLEGTDHSQPLAKFAYPWNADVNFFYNEEALAIDLGGGTYLSGLEVGNCHGKDTDKASGQADCRSILNTEFKPAYLLAWENSTLIFPIKSDHPYYDGSVAGTLANINSHLSGETYAENFRLGQYNSRLGYADMQFWIEGDATYTLYYYDEKAHIYKPDISLLSQNGTPTGADPDAQNEWFRAQRRARFMASAGEWFDLDDTIFHYVFCLMFGATDNFAKNSYPYKMAAANFVNGHNTGGKWKWRQDDLDTIFDIDNSGRDSKPYMIEYEDATGTTAYFAGSNSVFWTLIHECYWDDYNGGLSKGIRSIGRDVVNKMMDLSHSNNKYDGIVSFISQCFWDNAQAYFPESAYNVDCEFKYEQAWLNNGQSVPPLSQALGNHYSGERLWVQRRAVYILSLFRTGPFGDYSDVRLGTISFRPTAIEVTLTPMMWLYPALCIGQNNVVNAARTQAGVGRTISASVDPSGNTAAYIQASNYYTTLGNLKALNLGLQDIGNITITAAKLVQLLIGSENAGEVTTNIPGVILAANLKCVETIDFRNAYSIRSIAGLANCARLRTLLLAGTRIPLVELQRGSKVETIVLPATIQKIVLVNLKHLTSFSVESYAEVATVHIEDTDIDAFAILTNAYNGSSVLEYIRIAWLGVLQSEGVAVLTNLNSSRYKGLDADGTTVLPKPFVEGTVQVSGIYTDSLEQLNIVSTEDYEAGMKKALSRMFNTNLYIIYDPVSMGIRFQDAAVEAICLANWDTNHDNMLSVAEAGAVTALASKFKNNTTIKYFNEFKYFTGITAIASGTAFTGCTALEEISLPEGLVNLNGASGNGVFQGCTKLHKLSIPKTLRTSADYNFTGCTNLRILEITDLREYMNMQWGSTNGMNVQSVSGAPFSADTSGQQRIYLNGEEIVDLVIPSGVTSIRAAAFYRWCNIRSVTFPSTLQLINSQAFLGWGNLTSLNLTSPIRQIGRNAFAWCGITDLTIGPSMVEICITAFQYCTHLTEVSFPPSLQSILDSAFSNCSALARITFSHPNTSLTIQNGVFNNTQVTRIDFPDIQTLVNMNWAGNEPFWSNVSTTGRQYHSVYIGGENVTEFEFPAGTTSIKYGVLAGWNTMKKLTIPSTVTSIGNYAFANIWNLEYDVDIPCSVSNAVVGRFGCLNQASRKNTLTIHGNLSTFNAYYQYQDFRRIIIHGNAVFTGNMGLSGDQYVQYMRIKGEFNPNAWANSYIMSNANTTLHFVEVLGNVKGILMNNSTNGCAFGTHIHLGYNGVVTAAVTGVLGATVRPRIFKVYVGTGESQAADEAVLQQYLADSNWAAFSYKLDIWWNYKLKGRLPDGYTRLEYIWSNNSNQYINTGVPGNNDNLRFKFGVTFHTFVAYGAFFGNYVNEGSDCWRLIFQSANTGVYVTSNKIASGGTMGYSQSGSMLNQYLEFDIYADGFDMFNAHKNSPTSRGVANNTNILIGRCGENANSVQKRFYYFQIYDNGVLIRDYAPCKRNSDGICGFYDTINNTFNPSIGSENFAAGYDFEFWDDAFND